MDRKSVKIKMIKKQERNWGISPAAHLCVEICVFLFGIWGKRQGLREEEDRGGNRDREREREREKKEKEAVCCFTHWWWSWAPCKNSPGYVRHLECRVTSSVCPGLWRGCPLPPCSLPLLWQRSEEPPEATPVRTGRYWQDTHASRETIQHEKRDPRSSPRPSRHTLNGIWAWKEQRQLQSSAELFGGCSYSLIWQQSWEIIWISLVSVACLSGFSADWVPSGMFLSLLRACVCGRRVCGLICLFCHSWFFFSCCLHVGFVFWDRRRACVCGWARGTIIALRGGCFIQTLAAPLAVFSPSPPSLCPPSHRGDGLCLLEQHTHLGAAACNQRLTRVCLLSEKWTGACVVVGEDSSHDQLDVSFFLPLMQQDVWPRKNQQGPRKFQLIQTRCAIVCLTL